MMSRFSHIAYIDDSGDLGFPQGTELAVLVALVYKRHDAVVAKRRLRVVARRLLSPFGFPSLPELHCPSWIRELDHNTGLNLADRLNIMDAFLREVSSTNGRLVAIVFDKRRNQPARPEGIPAVFVWRSMFEEILKTCQLDSDHRIQWRVDGRSNPRCGSAARLVRATCTLTCGVDPAVCSAPVRYVDSTKEILIQAADAAAHLLYQSILPSPAHLKYGLPFDISMLDPLTRAGVIQSFVDIRLRPTKEKTAEPEQEQP